MQVDCPHMTFAEQVVLHLDRPGVRLALCLVLGDQTAIFCLETNDSVHRFAASDENRLQATEKSSRDVFMPVVASLYRATNPLRFLCPGRAESSSSRKNANQPLSTFDTGWKPMLLYSVAISTWVREDGSAG